MIVSVPPPPPTKGQLSTLVGLVDVGLKQAKLNNFEAFHLPGAPKLRRINIPFALNFLQLLTPVQSIVQSHSPQTTNWMCYLKLLYNKVIGNSWKCCFLSLVGLFKLHSVEFVFLKTSGQKMYFNKCLQNLFASLFLNDHT